MLYSDYLKKDHQQCPFCKYDSGRIFIESDLAFLTYALAPYHKHHLLVVPKKHHISFLKIGTKENGEITRLIKKAEQILKNLGYDTFTVLVREGKSKSKSMEHLHYHVIPNERIGDLGHDGNQRRIMTPEEISSISGEIRNAIKDLK